MMICIEMWLRDVSLLPIKDRFLTGVNNPLSYSLSVTGLPISAKIGMT
jgi:hypothetical protein